MPLFSKHRSVIYEKDGTRLLPDAYEPHFTVYGFSNPRGKPNRRPVAFMVTTGPDGKKRFTLKGLLG